MVGATSKILGVVTEARHVPEGEPGPRLAVMEVDAGVTVPRMDVLQGTGRVILGATAGRDRDRTRGEHVG